MQGFGGSPSSWQQADVTAQESLCLSCSTAASNVSMDYPGGCTCIHDQADIHTYVQKELELHSPECLVVFYWLFLPQQYSSEDAVPEHEEADRLQGFLWMQVSIYPHLIRKSDFWSHQSDSEMLPLKSVGP